MQRSLIIWKVLLAFAVAASVAACGGGGGSGDSSAASSPSPAPVAAGPWIRYQAVWTGNTYSLTGTAPPATLSIAPVAGASTIGSNAIARVEVLLGYVALGAVTPVVLSGPNSTDAQGRPRYLFNFGQLTGPGIPTIDCGELPIRITVVDVTGFSFDKYMMPCRAGTLEFGAYSDYGTTPATISFSTPTAYGAVVTRRSAAGDVIDRLYEGGTTFTIPLVAADGDRMDVGTHFPPGTPPATARIDAGGGTFAESVTGANAMPPQAPFVLLQCCGPRPPGGGNVDAVLRLNGLPIVTVGPSGIVTTGAAATTYTYALRVTDPSTGVAVLSSSNTAVGSVTIPVSVARGNVVEVDVTPTASGMYADASMTLGRAYNSVYAVSSRPGTPARFRVYCCAP